MNPKWLDRSIILSPFLALCTKPKQFTYILKYLKVPKKEWPKFVNESCGATCHQFDKEDGTLVSVVCLAPTKVRRVAVYALLAHEARHVIESIYDMYSGMKRDEELEAVAIQMVTVRLIDEYKRQRRSK